MRQKVAFTDLGLMDYQQAWQYQSSLHERLKEDKKSGAGIIPGHTLIFCEHPPVFTLGKSGSEEHLKLSLEELSSKSIAYHRINRGGDITYHGPGQIVGYPVFDLDYFFHDVHRYVRHLEEAIIQTLQHYSLVGQRIAGYTGVWIRDEKGERKICAIGVHFSRWVSLHGFAFNINTCLDPFQFIVPCGIRDDHKSVTSMEKELGFTINLDEVKELLKYQIADIFSFDYQ